MIDPNSEPVTPYLAIQKYLEVLEAVQKALGIETVGDREETIEPEIEKELIELEPVEPDTETVSRTVTPQTLFEKNNTWTAEQLAEEKSDLAELKAENLMMSADNHKKFIQSQANFAQAQALFAASQGRFNSRRQEKSRQQSLRGNPQ
ncbi:MULTISPECIES: hypothetical protein [Nostocales]|uniref:Uncharacterized protein n=3 Tax=Nostocales TaxID=1161 RepID=A0A0C1QZB0_9CYAN|nr:hypothetical protein [Tolypothrix bouteillei]KAF3886839.1 hypothetical protein DA73_0400016110 [Tolypothrix bouteillei VB521301]